jgi:type II secretory pathway pseudopilin PulG
MNSGHYTAGVRQNPQNAFTLTELLVVLAMMILLAILVFPALATVPVKSGRMQCANNLRQIGADSMAYAMENGDVLPVCTVGSVNGGGKSNNLAGLFYTRYVYTGNPMTSVPTNSSPASTYYQNLGYLYHSGQAGRGQFFFCPDQWGTALGANNYSPLLTTDASGTVRSSYAYNPRIVDPTNGVIARKYQKTSDLPPHKLLAVDYFANDAGGPNSPPVHFRERGWNVLFTDSSVQFSQNIQAYNYIQNFVDNETTPSREAADVIMNQLELDH